MEYEHVRQMNEIFRNSSSSSSTGSLGTETTSFGTDLEAPVTNSRIQDVQEPHPYRDLICMDEVHSPLEDYLDHTEYATQRTPAITDRIPAVRFPRFSTPEPEEEVVFRQGARRAVTIVQG
ncbi:hypothetical protein MMC14_001593 [Varicellaria rhodocarpa]|nr:hypothetical protein [Varicellaria rhodocarpa]